jgi:hypothetical protein
MAVFTHYFATDRFESAMLATQKTPWWWQYDVTKHVAELLTSDVYTLVVYINFYAMYSTYSITILKWVAQNVFVLWYDQQMPTRQ